VCPAEVRLPDVHWATTDDMIADLIAGGLMLAFGVLVLLMWSFQR
jgi:hypothetical protein